MTVRPASVALLYPATCREVPAMLRQAADTIAGETEEDNRTLAMVAVQLHEDGTVQVYGWGDTDDLHALGTLHLGLRSLTDAIVEDDE